MPDNDTLPMPLLPMLPDHQPVMTVIAILLLHLAVPDYQETVVTAAPRTAASSALVSLPDHQLGTVVLRLLHNELHCTLHYSKDTVQ